MKHSATFNDIQHVTDQVLSDSDASDAPQAAPSATPDALPAKDWWWQRAAAAIVLPAALYLVLRPEQYSLVPNGLDPIFYTGYAVNFDDIMREIGGAHYFVSRWPAYMSSRVFSELFGPVFGRLVLRWVVASSMVMALWHLAKRWSWNRWTEMVAGVVVLTTPMFARAYMSDYVEWLIVGLGFILVCQCLEERILAARSFAIGVIGALIVICNPAALTLLIGPMSIYAVRAYRQHRNPALQVGVLAVGAFVIVVAGWALFRVRYNIPNVYRPTIEFMQRQTGADTAKSPQLDWMASFTWIYAPLILVGGALVVPRIRKSLFDDRIRLAAIGLLVLQYLFQWLDQFARDGMGLELEYYWVLVCPTFLVAVAVLLGIRRWSAGEAIAFTVAWIGVLFVTAHTRLHLPAGWAFALLAVALIVGLAATHRAPVALLLGVIALFMLATQVAAPRYDATAHPVFNSDPMYADLYYHHNSYAVQEYHELLWFERTLDEIDDRGLYMMADGPAEAITGLYGVHVTGKLLRAGPGRNPDAAATAAMRTGLVPRIAVYGPPVFVEQAVAHLLDEPLGGTVELARTNSGGLGYELVVVDMPDPASDSFTWTAAQLPSLTGVAVGETRQAEPNRDQAGVLTYGPYTRLGIGSYLVTLSYSSPAPPSVTVGTFDAYQNGTTWTSKPLMGTNGRVATTELSIDAGAVDGWEFRTFWDGASPLTVVSVQTEPLDTVP